MNNIEKAHLAWFKVFLKINGAPESITNRQVKNSCGFKDSERAFVAGWDFCMVTKGDDYVH